MTAIILAALLSLRPYPGDEESPAQRSARLTVVADAIAHVCEQRAEGGRLLCAANLIAIGYVESRFARFVTEGCINPPKRFPRACDRDRHGRIRARTPWQLWRAACSMLPVNPHDLAPGSRAQLRAAATCAEKRLRGAAYRCRGQNEHGVIGGMFAGYRSSDCAWVGDAHQGVAQRIFVRGVVLRRLRSK